MFSGEMMPELSCVSDLAFQTGIVIQLNPPKDGNCQFAAAAVQLTIHRPHLEAVTAHDVRQQVVERLSTKPNLGDGSAIGNFVFPITDWNSYLEKMARSGTFGDCITLLMIAQCFNVQIIVLSTLGSAGTRSFLPTNDCYDPTVPVILLGHIQEGKGDHYVSLKAESENIMTSIVNDAFKLNFVTSTPQPQPIIVDDTFMVLLDDSLDSNVPKCGSTESRKEIPDHIHDANDSSLTFNFSECSNAGVADFPKVEPETLSSLLEESQQIRNQDRQISDVCDSDKRVPSRTMTLKAQIFLTFGPYTSFVLSVRSIRGFLHLRRK